MLRSIGRFTTYSNTSRQYPVVFGRWYATSRWSDITKKPVKEESTNSSNKEMSSSSVNSTIVKKKEEAGTGRLFEAISELDNFNIRLRQFPNLVMVGPQSSGKTSVVEAVCGRNFMPKKMGMATMKPFHITTIRSDQLKFKIRDKEVSSEDEARDIVERLNINPNIKKIDVQVWSPTVYNAHLIDLPGLFYVSKEDRELPKKVKEMSEKYLEDANNIPCVVSSATQDPATNQAIQLISEHNREPDSIGIITKVDLVVKNQSTKIIESMLRGGDDQSYSLGHSWVAVVLKNTKDNEAGMTVDEKIQHEERFFQKHPQFQPAGVNMLREAISRIQFEKIRDNIPGIIAEVDTKIQDLTKSGTFLDEIMSDPKNKLAFRLKMMIEKLVGSSLERAEFEDNLKKTFKEKINGYLEQSISGEALPELPRSDKDIPPGLVTYHTSNKTNPTAYATDNFRELFSFGLISPILANSETIERAFNQETQLMCTVPMLDLSLDDPLGKKRLQWNKDLRRYFNALLADDHILDMIYQTTEEMILDYLYSDPDGIDAVTRKFAEYIVREIGSEAYESKIRFALKAMINIEKRPLISQVEIARHLGQMYQEDFRFRHGAFMTYWNGEDKRHKIDVYGPAFNQAYLRAVSDKLSENVYRNVAVNLLDRMVEKLLEMTIDMFNQETVLKEKNKVSEKIERLKNLRMIIERYI